jgi:hypothetical protein
VAADISFSAVGAWLGYDSLVPAKVASDTPRRTNRQGENAE